MKTVKKISIVTALHATVVSVLLLLFLWPAATAESKNLPIGLVGPSQQTAMIADRLSSQSPNALIITEFETASDAQTAIEQKEIYGAIVLGTNPSVIVASAANPSVANSVKDLGNKLLQLTASQQGNSLPSVGVTDLAELPANDPRGAIFGGAALPLVIGGISLGAIGALQLRSRRDRIIFGFSASTLTGLLAAVWVSSVFGALPAGVAANWLVFSAIIAAIGFSLMGSHTVAGIAGFGITAATLFLVGNPLNGVGLPMEFYADPWGQIGQMMPIGSGFELLKRVNFFEAASQSQQWFVLGAWGLVGLSLTLIRSKQNTLKTATETDGKGSF